LPVGAVGGIIQPLKKIEILGGYVDLVAVIVAVAVTVAVIIAPATSRSHKN
jgi:hypothetical protein